jgi:hypothetical protein
VLPCLPWSSEPQGVEEADHADFESIRMCGLGERSAVNKRQKQDEDSCGLNVAGVAAAAYLYEVCVRGGQGRGHGGGGGGRGSE